MTGHWNHRIIFQTFSSCKTKGRTLFQQSLYDLKSLDRNACNIGSTYKLLHSRVVLYFEAKSITGNSTFQEGKYRSLPQHFNEIRGMLGFVIIRNIFG